MMHRKRFHDFGWTKTWIIYLNCRLDLLGREHWFYTIMFDLQSYLNMMMSRHSPSLLTPTVFSGTEMVMGFLGLQLSLYFPLLFQARFSTCRRWNGWTELDKVMGSTFSNGSETWHLFFCFLSHCLVTYHKPGQSKKVPSWFNNT